MQYLGISFRLHATCGIFRESLVFKQFCNIQVHSGTDCMELMKERGSVITDNAAGKHISSAVLKISG